MGIREAEEKQVKWSRTCLGGLHEQLHVRQTGGTELYQKGKTIELVLIVQLRVVKQQSP